MQFSDKEFAQYSLQNGDILLNEGQSRELVGRSAIFHGEVHGACFQNTLIRFRPLEVVTTEFAHRYFQYCLYTGCFVANSKQTTSIAHLGVKRFAKMLMPVPGKGQQESITRCVSSTEQRLRDLKVRQLRLRALKARIVSGTLVRDEGLGA